jgi:hypothetical protein
MVGQKILLMGFTVMGQSYVESIRPRKTTHDGPVRQLDHMPVTTLSLLAMMITMVLSPDTKS